MSEISISARPMPLTKYAPPPFLWEAPDPESEHTDAWDRLPDRRAGREKAMPLQAKRPLGGSEGIPETQPDADDLLNMALAVITGLSLIVVMTGLLRMVLPRD